MILQNKKSVMLAICHIRYYEITNLYIIEFYRSKDTSVAFSAAALTIITLDTATLTMPPGLYYLFAVIEKEICFIKRYL